MSTRSFDKIFRVKDPATVKMIAEQLSQPPKNITNDTSKFEDDLKRGRELLKRLASSSRNY